LEVSGFFLKKWGTLIQKNGNNKARTQVLKIIAPFKKSTIRSFFCQHTFGLLSLSNRVALDAVVAVEILCLDDIKTLMGQIMHQVGDAGALDVRIGLNEATARV
jgi:hypothetical protein